MIDVLRSWAFPTIPLVDVAKDKELRRRELEAEQAANEALEGMKKARLSFDSRPIKESGGIDQLRKGLKDSDADMREALRGK